MGNKPFTVANLREITDQYEKEEITYSRMVEMLNEKAKEFYEQWEKKPIIKAGFTTYRPGIDKWANKA